MKPTTYRFDNFNVTETDASRATMLAWAKHMHRYGSRFSLLRARMDLPIQGVSDADPTIVLRICKNVPIQMKQGIPMEGTAWGLVLRRVDDGWVVISITPLFSNKMGPEYLSGQRFDDSIVARAA